MAEKPDMPMWVYLASIGGNRAELFDDQRKAIIAAGDAWSMDNTGRSFYVERYHAKANTLADVKQNRSLFRSWYLGEGTIIWRNGRPAP